MDCRIVRAAGLDRVVELASDDAQPAEQRDRVGIGHQALECRQRLVVVGVVLGQHDFQLRVAEHLVQARGALQRRGVAEQFLGVARGVDAVADQRLALLGEPSHLDRRVHDGNEQWHGDQREADQQQSTE